MRKGGNNPILPLEVAKDSSLGPSLHIVSIPPHMAILGTKQILITHLLDIRVDNHLKKLHLAGPRVLFVVNLGEQ